MDVSSAGANQGHRLSQRAVDHWLRDVLGEVRHAPRRWSDVLEAHGEPLIAFRADRTIAKANRGAEVIFGYGPGELDGATADALLPERLRQPEAPDLALTGDITTVEMPALTRDGGEVLLAWTFGGVDTPSGALFLATARPRTEIDEALDALHDSEERFRLLVDGIRDHALFMLDADGRVASWNTGAEQIKGWSAQEILGKHYETFFVPEDRAAGVPAQNLARAAAEGRAELQGWRIRKDGTRFYAEASLWPLYRRDGSLRGFAKITHDLTDRQRAEEATRRLVAERAAREAAESAQEQLRESDRRKSEFLAVLSHELRNPLSAISVGIDVVEAGYAGTPDGRAALSAIRRQTNHLTRLIDDLLDLTRIERGKVTLQCGRCDLATLVRQAVDDLRAAYARAAVQLSVEIPAEPLWVHADPARVTQIVTNLLHNAIKFTPARGTVTVALRRDGDVAELAVRDTGVGMDPDVIPRLFEPFTQGGPGLRGSAGLGLGLALVKAIVELHGGRVEARSDGHGTGSEFVVRLGLTSPADAASSPVTTPLDVPRRVLLVEDNEDIGELLANALTQRGHTVRLARLGRDGLNIAREFEPDVVVCDLGLPDMDGHDIARELRASSALQRSTLIALSGFAQPEDRQRARDAGFDVHLAKPASIAAIVSAMARR